MLRALSVRAFRPGGHGESVAQKTKIYNFAMQCSLVTLRLFVMVRDKPQGQTPGPVQQRRAQRRRYAWAITCTRHVLGSGPSYSMK
jgi:hypothetical protein